MHPPTLNLLASPLWHFSLRAPILNRLIALLNLLFYNQIGRIRLHRKRYLLINILQLLGHGRNQFLRFRSFRSALNRLFIQNELSFSSQTCLPFYCSTNGFYSIFSSEEGTAFPSPLLWAIINLFLFFWLNLFTNWLWFHIQRLIIFLFFTFYLLNLLFFSYPNSLISKI